MFTGCSFFNLVKLVKIQDLYDFKILFMETQGGPGAVPKKYILDILSFLF